MTDSDREDGVPGDGADTTLEPSRAERKAAKKAAKVLKKQAKATRKAVKQAAKAEAKAAATVARAAAKAAAKAAKADARARRAAKAEAKAAQRMSRSEGATGGAPTASPAASAASALLEEAADLLRRGERGPESMSPAAGADLEPAGGLLTSDVNAAPEAEFEPVPEAAPVVEPEEQPLSRPGVEPAAEPLGAEVVSAPLAEDQAGRQAEPVAEYEPEPGPAEPELAPEFEPEEAPEFEPEPTPAEPEEAPAFEPVPAPEFEPVPDAEPGPETESAPEEGPQVESAPDEAAEAESAPGFEPAAEAIPAGERTFEPEPEAPIEFEPEPELVGDATSPTAAAEPVSEFEPEGARGAPDPQPGMEAPIEFVPELEDGLREAGETPLEPQFAAMSAGPVAAAIDIGSTSIHLLVGTVDGHRVVPLLDESEFLGLGDRAAADGYLGDEARSVLLAALERYAAAARSLGARTVTVVGTEPLRRAADAPAVIHEAATRLRLDVHVLDHGEEGLLTLIGATGGSPVSGELLLVDVGGGSSEFVTVDRSGHTNAVGLPLGAARLTREFVRSDPPSLAEIEALRREVARLIVDAPAASPVEIVAVGGTASNLLRLLPATAVDRSLTRRRIAVALAMLTVERSREAAVRHVIRPERARILPAGAIIVDAILERYRSDRLRVSEEGLREGLVLAGIHEGAAWRDRLARMARGWTESASEA